MQRRVVDNVDDGLHPGMQGLHGLKGMQGQDAGGGGCGGGGDRVEKRRKAAVTGSDGGVFWGKGKIVEVRLGLRPFVGLTVIESRRRCRCCGCIGRPKGVPGSKKGPEYFKRVDGVEGGPEGVKVVAVGPLGLAVASQGDRRRAKEVVALLLLRLTQRVVGLCNFLELVLGPRIRILVRVILEGQPAVGLPDVLVAGPRVDAQNGVIVFAHDGRRWMDGGGVEPLRQTSCSIQH